MDYYFTMVAQQPSIIITSRGIIRDILGRKKEFKLVALLLLI